MWLNCTQRAHFANRKISLPGNRRYYRRGDVELVRAIRGLLYEEGYTIGGARQRLTSEDGPSPVELMASIKDCLNDLEKARSLLIRDQD